MSRPCRFRIAWIALSVSAVIAIYGCKDKTPVGNEATKSSAKTPSSKSTTGGAGDKPGHRHHAKILPIGLACKIAAPPGCVIEIPGGDFHMGAQATDPDKPGYNPAATAAEGPVRRVRVKSFFLDKTEVKAWQFEKCVAQGACQLEDVAKGGGYFNYGQGRYGVVNGVTWRGARDYCKWTGGRLPTEVEWEFAARGTEARIYPWGDSPPNCTRAVLGSPDFGCGADRPSEEPRKEGNTPEYIRDLAGNLWEWTADIYTPQHGSPAEKDELRRAARGGGWTDTNPAELRSSNRVGIDPNLRLDDVGIRCARDQPRPPPDP